MAAIVVASSATPIASSQAVQLKGPSSFAGKPVILALNRRARPAAGVSHHKVQATLEVPRMSSSSDAALSALNVQLEMSKRQFVTALLISAAGVVLPCCQGTQSARAEQGPAKAETAPSQASYGAGYMPIKGPCCE